MMTVVTLAGFWLSVYGPYDMVSFSHVVSIQIIVK